MWLGINPDGNSEGETAAPWANAANQLDWKWRSPQDGQPLPPSFSTSPQNYPLSPAKTVSAFANYPLGDYQIFYAGDGTVVPDGCFTVTKPPVRGGDGVFRGVWTKRDNGGCGITVSPGLTETIRGLVILRPDVPPGQTFAPAYIKGLQQFGLLRFMDLTKTNNHPYASFSDRIAPDQFGYTGDKGVPLEVLCQLVTQVGRSAWFPIPHKYSDDDARAMFQLVKANTPPGVKKRFSFSNEVWNKQFQQFHDLYALAQASSLPGLGTDKLGRTYQYVGHRAARLAQIMREVFPPAEASFTYDGWIMDGGDVHTGEGAWMIDLGLQIAQQFYAPPATLFDAVAVAPYFGLAGLYDEPDHADQTPDLATLFQNIDKTMALQTVPWSKRRQQQAAGYGMRLLGYEGGIGLILKNNPALNDLKKAAQRHPAVAQRYTAWGAAIAPYYDGVCHLSWVGSNPMWALYQSFHDTASVKGPALMALQAPLPPPWPGTAPSPPPPPPPPPPAPSAFEVTFSGGPSGLDGTYTLTKKA